MTEAKHSPLPDNPKHIWLSPRCEIHGDGRTWCDQPQEDCGDCGEKWVKYARADLTAELVQALEQIDQITIDYKACLIARSALQKARTS